LKGTYSIKLSLSLNIDWLAIDGVYCRLREAKLGSYCSEESGDKEASVGDYCRIFSIYK
jgi:hypothetical protein